MDTMPLAAKRAVAFSSISPFVPILISALVLYGWLFDIPNLQSVLSGFPTMKVNTALCFIFSGLSLLLWHRADPAAPTHWNMAKPWAITLASLTLIISGGYTRPVYFFIQCWNRRIPAGSAADR